jgi:hypothetical protein
MSATRLRTGGMLLAVLAAGVALVVWAIFAPREAAAGWLIGFLFWSQIPVGALVLSMIHTLTGGRWGFVLRPVLAPATAAVPWLFIAAVPVFIAVPALYPWVQDAGAVQPDVAAHYLNTPFFIGRTLIALAVWSALSLLMRRAESRGGLLTAGVGLLLYGVTISSVAIDWFLSLEPPFVSSSFGASVGIMQLVTAMAWAALLCPEAENDPTVGDIGGMLLAFVLGITYVDFMAYLVIWYGDLPHESFWFVSREPMPWSALAGAWFVFGSVIPILVLLLARVRTSRSALRLVGLSVLVGSLLDTVWLVAPAFGAAALVPTLLAVVAIGAVQTLLVTSPWFARRRREASAHGY